MINPTLHVTLPHTQYPIYIGAGILRHVVTLIAAKQTHVHIITDDVVAPLYLSAVQAVLHVAGKTTSACVVPHGESSKDWNTLAQVCESMLQHNVERAHAVLALGGGVIGDLVGLAASLVRRGVQFIQIPTTLLAQTDSSVGGKTAINTRAGKNLVGSFYQPQAVLIDTDTLQTLPIRQLRAGYAEVLKYAFLGDAAFLTQLNNPSQVNATIIGHCCAMKAAIVSRDEKETGERALLNLGHTFGHAFEAEAGYDEQRLLHGEAVAVGMVLAFELSARLGYCPTEAVNTVRACVQRANLPTHWTQLGLNTTPNALLQRMYQDKKVQDGTLTFILARDVGQAFIANNIAPSHVLAVLAA